MIDGFSSNHGTLTLTDLPDADPGGKTYRCSADQLIPLSLLHAWNSKAASAMSEQYDNVCASNGRMLIALLYWFVIC